MKVLNRKKHGALIIQVRGTRLALGKHISSNIEIKQEAVEDKQENPETKPKNVETGRKGSGQEVHK